MYLVCLDLECMFCQDLIVEFGFFSLLKFYEIVQQLGGGYYDYFWWCVMFDDLVGKIFYVIVYKFWDWVIGIGVYVDDIEVVFWENMIWFVGIVVGLIGLFGGVCYFFIVFIIWLLVCMVYDVEGLVVGDIDIVFFGVDWKDEIGMVVCFIVVFWDQIFEQ